MPDTADKTAEDIYVPCPTYLDEANLSRRLMRGLRARWRLFLVLLVTIIALPLHVVLHAIHPVLARFIRRSFHRNICRALNIKIVVHGAIDKQAVLFVGNHATYLDIPILGGKIDADFIAKDDIDSWPGFGALARMADTLYVSRNRSSTGAENKRIHNHMMGGRAMILFPEGTASDNGSILPFKSSFFAIAQGEEGEPPLYVQPFVLTYAVVGGQKVDMDKPGLRGGRSLLNIVTWHDDMEFFQHGWRFLHNRKTVVHLDFLPAITMADTGGNRKHLCQAAEQQVRQVFQSRR